MSTGKGNERVIRFGLWYLAITSAYVAVWILIAPKGFYDAFPTGPRHWVNAIPPYNEHLERDFGAAGLGLSVLAGLAAVWWRERRLVQATAIAFLAASIPHLAYHLTTTDRYSTSDNVQSLVGLALPVLISVALLVATSGQRWSRHMQPTVGPPPGTVNSPTRT
jgi:hypothetical protein